MLGPVILIVAMAVVAPVGLFVVGAIWSGLTGWFLSDDADGAAGREAETQASTS